MLVVQWLKAQTRHGSNSRHVVVADCGLMVSLDFTEGINQFGRPTLCRYGVQGGTEGFAVGTLHHPTQISLYPSGARSRDSGALKNEFRLRECSAITSRPRGPRNYEYMRKHDS